MGSISRAIYECIIPQHPKPTLKGLELNTGSRRALSGRVLRAETADQSAEPSWASQGSLSICMWRVWRRVWPSRRWETLNIPKPQTL